MNTQPKSRSDVEALRWANILEHQARHDGPTDYKHKAAAELRRLHALNQSLAESNVELLEVLKAYQDADEMPTYCDASDFVWPKSEMRKPGETAWGWICEKHGLGYQSGCICCRNEFDEHRKRKNRDARDARDDALCAARDKARAALAKASGEATKTGENT